MECTPMDSPCPLADKNPQLRDRVYAACPPAIRNGSGAAEGCGCGRGCGGPNDVAVAV